MLNGVFDSMRGIVDSMYNQIQNLQRMQNLATVDAQFKSMPSLEVASNLDFSSLIEEIGKNSTEAGTTLLSEGSPVAVIFSTEQYKRVSGIVKFIPAVMEHMRIALENRVEYKNKLKDVSVELLQTAGDFLHVLPFVILMGTVFTVAGAFFLGDRYRRVEKDQTESRQKYIAPAMLLAVGLGTLVFSAYKASQTSCRFIAAARFLSAFPQ